MTRPLKRNVYVFDEIEISSVVVVCILATIAAFLFGLGFGAWSQSPIRLICFLDTVVILGIVIRLDSVYSRYKGRIYA